PARSRARRRARSASGAARRAARAARGSSGRAASRRDSASGARRRRGRPARGTRPTSARRSSPRLPAARPRAWRASGGRGGRRGAARAQSTSSPTSPLQRGLRDAGLLDVIHRVFLLSPASCAGRRCGMLLEPRSAFELALRVRREGAAIGEVMSFMSALYFRGKLTYAQRFAAPPDGSPGVLVITPDRGLVAPGTAIDRRDLPAFPPVPV